MPSERLATLRNMKDPQKRGGDFELFIGSVFQDLNFRVVMNAGSATPRQTDLLATRGDEVYLVETKWTADKSDINDVDGLFTRLEYVPQSVVGVLVSYQGFTDSVRDRVKEKSHRPVLLVSGAELENALGWRDNFLGLLRRKKEALLVRREVLLDSEPLRSSKEPKVNLAELPASTTEFMYPDRSRSKCFASGGDFGQFTFVPKLPDIDWVTANGFGVTLDISLEIWEQEELIGLLLQMTKLGWVTDHGSWSIQQATTNWHGFGARTFAETVREWRARYKGLKTHHTEEVCYFDSFNEGWFTLTTAISADRLRSIQRAELSFQLIGIPLDQMPFQELSHRIGASGVVNFRPRNESSVRRKNLRTHEKPATLRPIAYVVETSDSRIPGDDEWVVGIVAKNPLSSPLGKRSKFTGDIPDMIRDSEYVISSLRSWHKIEHPVREYELWEIESAWTSDALVVRVLADWPYEPNEELPVLESNDPTTNIVEADATVNLSDDHEQSFTVVQRRKADKPIIEG